MSKIERKIGNDDGVQVEASEILVALAADRFSEARKRNEAVARYLSAGEGWREACHELGGAFAPAETKKQG